METANGSVQTDVRNDRASVEIFVPITRSWGIEPMIRQLNALETGDWDVSVLFCVDTTEITKHQIEDRCSYFELVYPYRVIHTNAKPAGEVRMATRRDHIRDMLNFAKKHIRDTDMVFMVEDDTKIEPSAFMDLITNFAHLENAGVKVGLVEGAQVGRHGYRMIGAWRTDDLHDPQTMETIPFNRSALLEKIDGGGLYCFVTPTHLFKSHEFYWHDECFAPDVTYGIELRKKGYQNFIDWSVEAGHMQQDGATLYPNENCVVVKYVKRPEGHFALINQGKKGYIS